MWKYFPTPAMGQHMCWTMVAALLLQTLCGCGGSGADRILEPGIMNEAQHSHYHVHASDASHDHSHAGESGGHTHTHLHNHSIDEHSM